MPDTSDSFADTLASVEESERRARRFATTSLLIPVSFTVALVVGAYFEAVVLERTVRDLGFSNQSLKNELTELQNRTSSTPAPPSSNISLLEENRRLTARVAELERQIEQLLSQPQPVAFDNDCDRLRRVWNQLVKISNQPGQAREVAGALSAITRKHAKEIERAQGKDCSKLLAEIRRELEAKKLPKELIEALGYDAPDGKSAETSGSDRPKDEKPGKKP